MSEIEKALNIADLNYQPLTWDERHSTVESAFTELTRLLKANIELANLNTTLIDFVSEVNYSPYSDSDCLSLLESLRSRAAAILKEIESPNINK